MDRLRSARVMAGYDASPAANLALDVAAVLLPRTHAWITYLWTPPFADGTVCRRLWRDATSLGAFVAAIEREGEAAAERRAAMGVALARAAGWSAEPLVERGYGAVGLQLADLAEKLGPDLVLMGTPGCGAVTGTVVRYSPRPVLMIPFPLLAAERVALRDGPVVAGCAGAPDLFAPRELVEGPAGAERLAAVAAARRAAVIVAGARTAADLHDCPRPVLIVPEPRGGT
ncbi:hypothetical protein Ade02nite_70880 [Paractinoplanes deccanensis]|uniref:UspA domain-containing protein n=1 Tax=Paractinoplanes deccanensis TaxID=113561 RepID=A0ABQ3YEN6_9ACTN|nr:universal stress protein [Actinoplanes deccanensis]GID78447.1 hypothetical protein Ade02nite_70880 [Actinoplanes deccanensis]